MKDKPKLIFFAPILEYPPKGGPQLSVVNAIKVLNEISDLHVITSVNESYHDLTARNFIKKHSKKYIYTPSSKIFPKRFLNLRHVSKLKRLLNPFTGLVDAFFIYSFANKNKIDLIWIDRIIEHSFFTFLSLRLLNNNFKIVADTETVYSDFILRELPLIRNPIRYIYVYLRGRFAKFQERLMIDKANIITAVSETDRNHYLSLRNRKNENNIFLFSNVVDISTYERQYSNISKEIKQPFIILMGSFGHQHSPMDRAAKWLVHSIMPIVWDQIPDLNVCIVGRNSKLTQANLASSRVHILGEVPSVLPYLKQASISVVPLAYESGTRFKIVESGAASIPCISTSLGAEGLNVIENKNILIADDAPSFASAIIKLINNKSYAANLASELHDLVKRDYSLERQKRDGDNIIKFIKEI